MRFGISVPNFGDFYQPAVLAELAKRAEDSGFDGFFIWDHMLFWRNFRQPLVDPWVALSAIAVATRTIRIGPMVTPVARRRPWKLARETVSLDHLSNGRLILGVGLGAPADADFETFGEDGGEKVRSEKLDEGLDILTGLWSGEPFSYEGTHYRVQEDTFLPAPVQKPRIPVWVAGLWPNKPPFRRAARWDGVFPIPRDLDLEHGKNLSPEDVSECLDYIRQHRSSQDPFDVVLGGAAAPTESREQIEAIGRYAEAGVTWWIEGTGAYPGDLERMRTRIAAGPPH